MIEDKIKASINSKTTTELANTLTKKIQKYRAASLEPDSTQSIPNLDEMCAIAEELASRLAK